ncbi:hypothetical protein Tsubulata_001947 [Turnera subulata]|uniref:Uncharacterized protein n=1 Tax=Turnera subulata TaxID=218843 RepID=A0A9Q0J902_9ROSI|nr:hypothetical protein Tsubulata_001947 [Turnera subulata]
MEDSDQRKQRLNAMRAMAAYNETSSSSTNSGTFAAPPFLANPLLDNPPMQDHLRATQRFDFYTDPMAAFSGDRKRSNMAQDYSAPPTTVGPPVPRFSSPYQGPRYAQMNPSPGHQIQGNYMPPQGMYRPHGPYHNATPYRSPRAIGSPSPLNQGASPEGWNAPGVLPSHHGSASLRGVSSPYPMQQGSPSYNLQRGRGTWHGNSPGRGGNRNPGFARGGGRGRGFSPRNSTPTEMLGPECFYDKSMIEDPWKNLEPVLWKRLDAPLNNLNSPGSSNSWLPKSISTKKPRISESAPVSNSKQSLAEYLAASFNEASNDTSNT